MNRNHSSPYFTEIEVRPLLTHDEEIALGQRMRGDDKADASAARTILIESNLRLVVNIARKYRHSEMDLFDYIQAGNKGLIHAVDKYDETLGKKFSTYATYWIRESINSEIIDHAKTIRIPSYMTKIVSRWKMAVFDMRDHLGREPTDHEIQERLGITAGQTKIAIEAVRIPEVHHQPFTEDEDDRLATENTSPDRSDDDEYRVVQLKVLSEAIHRLPDSNREIIEARHLRGEMPEPVQTLAIRLSLSRERVRQIENESLQILKIALSGLQESA